MSSNPATNPAPRKSDLDVFRVHAPPDAFTRVYHEIIDNRDLTPSAKLLITHMLDQARKGEVYDIDRDTIAYWLGSGSRKGYAGRHVVDTAINNAKECGFVLSEQANSPADGRFIIHWYVTEVRGRFNRAQMSLPFAGEDDPPPERASPLSDFPTTDKPTAAQPTADEPTAEEPAAGAAPHGLMVNGLNGHGQERAGAKHGRERARRGGRQVKRNAAGGPCLDDLSTCRAFGDLSNPTVGVGELLALFRRERTRLSLNGCTWRQFLAAAVRAKNVVRREGGNVLALFAGIVNRRGANRDAPTRHWVVFSEEDLRETDELIERHNAEIKLGEKVEAIRIVARGQKCDPFEVARIEFRESLGRDMTRAEWEQLDRRHPA